jgi:magnesium transporter
MTIKDKKDLALVFLRTNPSSAAGVLEQQKPSQIIDFLQELSIEDASIILDHFLPSYAARIFTKLEISFAANIISRMEINKIASILKYMHSRARQDILKMLPLKVRRKCKLLLIYNNHSAGAWMITNIVVLPIGINAEAAVKILKTLENQYHLNYLYVVDQKNHLSGKVEIAALLQLQDHILIENILKQVKYVIHSYDHLEKVEKNFGWNSEDILPVLNAENELVGAIRHSDVRRWSGKVVAADKMLDQNDENLVYSLFNSYGEVLITLYEVIANITSKRA